MAKQEATTPQTPHDGENGAWGEKTHAPLCGTELKRRQRV
jgi:hypothetical protein